MSRWRLFWPLLVPVVLILIGTVGYTVIEPA